jgi:hypothetical protein
MKLELTHLEWRCVAVAKEVPDESAVFVHALGSRAVGHAGCLNYGGVRSHVIDNPNEAIVQDWKLLPKDCV